jgi:hypothetical protein
VPQTTKLLLLNMLEGMLRQRLMPLRMLRQNSMQQLLQTDKQPNPMRLA